MSTVSSEAATGQMAAIQVAIRAIIATHPDLAALTKAFEREHNETIAILAVRFSASDEIKQAYRDLLAGIAPNPDDWLKR